MSFIDGIKPIRYRMDDRRRYKGPRDGSKADPQESVGFSAQNIQEAAQAAGLPPELFVDASDPDKLGLKTDALIPFLVLEIQALKARLEKAGA